MGSTNRVRRSTKGIRLAFGVKLPLEQVINVDETGKELKREAFNMAKRFRDNGKAYFEFLLAAVRAYFQSQPAPG